MDENRKIDVGQQPRLKIELVNLRFCDNYVSSFRPWSENVTRKKK